MKYKYYFKKPKSTIVKDIFSWLAVGGLACFAASSPYFMINLMKGSSRWKKYKRKSLSNTFRRLNKQGHIKVSWANHQIYISLTDKGKKVAGWMQIDALKVKRPKKWDGKWRVVIFDIAQLKKFYREAFRGKLKELGFRPLQKSVWVHPFDCGDEIGLLKDFFGLGDREVRLMVADTIGGDEEIREFFKL